MGAKIRGAGTDVIRIEGVPALHSRATHTIIPDRIETGTYLSLAASIGDGILLKNVIPEHMESFTAKLVEMGVDLQINEDSIYVPRSNDLDPIRVKTMTYPGFATDLQQPITPLLLRANGSSVVIDTIYPQRTQHVEQLRKMGADIRVQDNLIVVGHSSHLQGAHVEAGEIRSGAALMIAGLAASGVTEISRADNILRGYDRVIDKLHTLGADVEIAADEEVPEN